MADEQRDDPIREAIAEGHALIRIQGSEMQKIAVLKPRDPEHVLARALKELDYAPELAAKNYYSIPYKDNRTNQTVFVEGLTIGAAANLGRLWGNFDVGSAIVDEKNDRATVQGIAVDLETNTRWSRPLTVSRMQSRRNGPPVRLSEERWTQLISANLSKAERNAALRMIPAWLQVRYFAAVKDLASKETRVAAAERGRKPWREVADYFKRIGVARPELEEVLGKPLPRMTDDDLATARGLANAVKSGERTWETILAGVRGGGPAKPQEPKMSVDDALSGGAKTVGGQEAADPEEAPQGRPDVPLGADPAVIAAAGLTACPHCARHMTFLEDPTVGHGDPCRSDAPATGGEPTGGQGEAA